MNLNGPSHEEIETFMFMWGRVLQDEINDCSEDFLYYWLFINEKLQKRIKMWRNSPISKKEIEKMMEKYKK
jgi:hypothetical protein